MAVSSSNAITTDRAGQSSYTKSSSLGPSSSLDQQKLRSNSQQPGPEIASSTHLDEEMQHPVKVMHDEVPDGGKFAWLQVFASFFLVFNTWGILNAFGVYQTYYSSGAIFEQTSSAIAWIGSLEAFMLLLTGCIAGPIYDKGHLRFLLLIGAFLIVFGHMMLSLCHAYWEVLLAQGLVIGMGTGCLFVPCVALLPQYFSSKLGLAMGLAIGGSSIGGIIYPIILYRLIGEIGFPWAVRIVGFVALGTLLIPILVLRLRVRPAKARSFIDWTAFTDIQYLGLLVSGFLSYMGLFVLLFYLSYYAADKHITDTSLAFYLVPIFNAGSCLGRTLPNALSDRTGPFNIIIPGTILVGVLELCLIPITSRKSIVALAVLSGVVSGVLIGILPLCFVALTKDKSKLGTRIGMGFAFLGFGVLSGGPGGGSILGDDHPLDWQSLWIFAAVGCFAATIGFIALRWSLVGVRLKVKA